MLLVVIFLVFWLAFCISFLWGRLFTGLPTDNLARVAEKKRPGKRFCGRGQRDVGPHYGAHRLDQQTRSHKLRMRKSTALDRDL